MSITSDIFRRQGSIIIGKILENMRSTGANATGKTAASVEQAYSDDRLLIFGGAAFGLNERDHRGFVEAGRAPGTMPPHNAIHDWAIARGLITPEDNSKNRSILFLIRRKIAQKGTDLWLRGEKRNIYFNVITEGAADSILEQIANVYTQKIFSEVAKLAA